MLARLCPTRILGVACSLALFASGCAAPEGGAPASATRPPKASAERASIAGCVREVEGHALRSAVLEGRRIAAASVTLDSAAPAPSSTRHGARRVLQDLPADGRFRADDLEPGTWEFTVKNSGRVPFETRVELERGMRHELELDLPLGLVVAGRVVDRYGDPVGGVAIQAVRGGGTPLAWSVPTDELGRFRLVGFESGDVWLHAFQLAARPSREGPVTMSDFEWKARAGREGLEIVQPIERTLSVRVVDARGRAVPDAELFVDQRRGCVTGGPRGLDAEGRARISHPEGHELKLRAWPPRDADGTRRGEPSATLVVRVEDREVEIVLPATPGSR